MAACSGGHFYFPCISAQKCSQLPKERVIYVKTPSGEGCTERLYTALHPMPEAGHHHTTSTKLDA
jgi:hypothetical protein